MELKVGYKQTQVGVIPEEWNVQAIDSFAVVTAGGTPSRQIADFWNGEIPWVTTTEINWNTIHEIPQSITAKGLDNSAAKLIAPGALLIALYGQGKTRGKVAILGIQAATNQACAAIIISPAVSRKFVFHFLVSQYSAIRALSNSGSQENLSGGIVKSILIPLPTTKVEQDAIAEALSNADALIESLDQLIAKKRQIKQGAMQELLTGKRRLPRFGGEWEVKRLGDVGNCLRGVTYNGDSDLWSHDTSHTKRLLRSNNVQNSAVVIDDIQFVNSDRVKSEQLLKPRDVLICMANGSKALVGKAGFFNVADGHEYTFGAFMGCFRTESTLSNPAFVFYLFQTARYRDYINNLLAGSSINNLNPGSIESLEFRLPQMTEQTAIATVLSDMDTELSALESRLAKARQIKQGMMQELLTGRIRLL